MQVKNKPHDGVTKHAFTFGPNILVASSIYSWKTMLGMFRFFQCFSEILESHFSWFPIQALKKCLPGTFFFDIKTVLKRVRCTYSKCKGLQR
jgi:hypothetical protein